MSATEKERRLTDLCLLLFYELGLYVWFLLIVKELVSSDIPTLARTRGPGDRRLSSSGLSQI